MLVCRKVLEVLVYGRCPVAKVHIPAEGEVAMHTACQHLLEEIADQPYRTDGLVQAASGSMPTLPPGKLPSPTDLGVFTFFFFKCWARQPGQLVKNVGGGPTSLANSIFSVSAAVRNFSVDIRIGLRDRLRNGVGVTLSQFREKVRLKADKKNGSEMRPKFRPNSG